MNTLQSMKVGTIRVAISDTCTITRSLVLKAKQKRIHSQCGQWKIKGNPARFYTNHVWAFEAKQYTTIV